MSAAGYAFVPLPPAVRQTPRRHAVWDRRYAGTLAGVLRVRLRAEQAVHVGSGHKRMAGSKVARAAVRIQGGPGIPGASLKGVLRSRYEAITRSCVQQPPALERMVKINSSTGIEKAKLSLQRHDGAYLGTRCSKDRLCAACALFGRMSLRSRVAVRDLACAGDVAFAIAPIHEQFGPNLHHVGEAHVVPAAGPAQKGRRPAAPRRTGKRAGTRRSDGDAYFEVTRLHGRKFALGMGPIAEQAGRQWIEVIPAGSILVGTIGVFNVQQAELGGLLSVLGRMHTGAPANALALGGGKGRGFGRLRLVDIGYELRDHTGHAIVVDRAREDAWRAAFETSEDRWETGEQVLHAIYRED